MVENLQYGKCLFQEVINEGCQGLWQEMMCKSSSHHVLEKHFGDTLMSTPTVIWQLFFYSTKMGEYVVSAGTAEKRMYWLQQLQKYRREFSAGGAAAIRNSVNPHQVKWLLMEYQWAFPFKKAHSELTNEFQIKQMGLLKTPESEDKNLAGSNEALKDTSPFKDLMATMEKPADLTAHPGTASSAFHQYHNIISPPKSADCVSKKTTFFQVSMRKHILWPWFWPQWLCLHTSNQTELLILSDGKP